MIWRWLQAVGLLAFAALWAGGACYDPKYQDGNLRCDGVRCPIGFNCFEGRCRRTPPVPRPDAAVDPVDAPAADASAEDVGGHDRSDGPPADLAPADAHPGALLTGLEVTPGALSPAFSADTTTYLVSVPLATRSVMVKPTARPDLRLMVNTSAPNMGVVTVSLNIGPNVIDVLVLGEGAAASRYTVTVIRGGLVNYVKATNTGSGDRFGNSVAMSADTLVVGAPYEDSGAAFATGTSDEGSPDCGAAYIYIRASGGWMVQAVLKPANAGPGLHFGASVALSGDTIAVGAPGENSATTGINRAPEGNATQSGAVYVFTRTNGVWTQQAYIKPSNTGVRDAFGTSVALTGSTLAVGAPGEDGGGTGTRADPNSNSASNAGAAYVFLRENNTWTQQAYIKASNTKSEAAFGTAVALANETLAVGAPSEDSGGSGINPNSSNTATDSGAVYVFVRSGTSWNQQVYLKGLNTQSEDEFGHSVALSGDLLAVGAPEEDGASAGIDMDTRRGISGSGAAYLFRRSGTTWQQQLYFKPSNTDRDDHFGTAVALLSDTLLVGAPGEDSPSTGPGGSQTENTRSNSGAAYLFKQTNGNWAQAGYLKAVNPGVNDEFGSSVAAFGDAVVIAAPLEDGKGVGTNASPINEGASDSGAVYVY